MFAQTSILAIFPSLIFFMVLLSGCTTTHTQFLSQHWVEQQPPSQLVSINTRSARLQVIITYQGLLSSHSALRLESFTDDAIFWDPAGAYGLVGTFTNPQGKKIFPYGRRERDIVMTHIPDIPTYMKFRWYVGDSSVEVFEWDVPAQQLEALKEVLLREADETHPKGVFQTKAPPAFCSIAISDFLQRFAVPIMTLNDTYLWPHNLGEALLDQSPSRVRVFFPNRNERIFTPPPSLVAQP